VAASTLSLKQSLLLIHGTVYGQESLPLPVVQLSGLTNSIERHNYAGFDWDVSVPYVEEYDSSMLSDSLINNEPIDVIHWGAAASEVTDLLAFWRTCSTLLVRL